MADVLFPSTSSAEDTIAQLDALFAKDQARKAADLRRLEAARQGLDVLSVPSDPDGGPMMARGGSGEAPAVRPSEPAPTPTVRLPQRTTHGGPFGPAVRAKLIREALGE